MKRVLGALLLGPFLLAAGSAVAEDKAAAKEAYNRGLEAHKRGDHQRAAEEFAHADTLAPSAVALQAALDASIDADDPALGSDLVERSQREPAPASLQASVDAARSRFAGRAGRVKVNCPKSCTSAIDGVAFDPRKPTWARTGQHIVVIMVDGEVQTRNVYVSSDQIADVTPTIAAALPETKPLPVAPPVPPATVETTRRDGLPPIVFFFGLGVTVVLGGVTGLLALETKREHDAFVSGGCERANGPGCSDFKSDGESNQSATNIALAGTAIVGVATAVIGIAFTDWKGPKATAAPAGTIGTWSVRF